MIGVHANLLLSEKNGAKLFNQEISDIVIIGLKQASNTLHIIHLLEDLKEEFFSKIESVLPYGLDILGIVRPKKLYPKQEHIIFLCCDNKIKIQQNEVVFKYINDEEEPKLFNNIATLALTVSFFSIHNADPSIRLKEIFAQRCIIFKISCGNVVVKTFFTNEKISSDVSIIEKEFNKNECDKLLHKKNFIQLNIYEPSTIKPLSEVIEPNEIKTFHFEEIYICQLNNNLDQHLKDILIKLQNRNFPSGIKLIYKNNYLSFPFQLQYDSANPIEQQNIYQASLKLPTDRPLIRIIDSVYNKFTSPLHLDKLKDVHLPIVKNQNGEKSLVDGSYIYFHYMQDGFNDDGWGCAYRSLQTLISWFLENNYCDGSLVAIPSHIEIQKILVAMGDKQKSFIGSKDWIGSFEVSYVLKKVCGIESTILHVENGSLVSSKASLFRDHFNNHGTPIMIGGGVLAYTLLGINIQEDGEVMFLILDPHYKGNDNLKTVISKKGVFWKDKSIFLKSNFYNFCCPIRPKYSSIKQKATYETEFKI